MKAELKKASKPGGNAYSKAAKKENPFDKFANPRRKHEILNRKVKGEDRNVGRARAKVSKWYQETTQCRNYIVFDRCFPPLVFLCLLGCR